MTQARPSQIHGQSFDSCGGKAFAGKQDNFHLGGERVIADEFCSDLQTLAFVVNLAGRWCVRLLLRSRAAKDAGLVSGGYQQGEQLAESYLRAKQDTVAYGVKKRKAETSAEPSSGGLVGLSANSQRGGRTKA